MAAPLAAPEPLSSVNSVATRAKRCRGQGAGRMRLNKASAAAAITLASGVSRCLKVGIAPLILRSGTRPGPPRYCNTAGAHTHILQIYRMLQLFNMQCPKPSATRALPPHEQVLCCTAFPSAAHLQLGGTPCRTKSTAHQLLVSYSTT